jgi:hypothetical protein
VGVAWANHALFISKDYKPVLPCSHSFEINVKKIIMMMVSRDNNTNKERANNLDTR